METILPEFDSANFRSEEPINNSYFPLPPGTVFSHSGTTTDEEVESNDVFVTYQKRDIDGVNTTVVRDTAYVDGVLAEDTFDWYAQDMDGNVWYLGELSFTYEFEDGTFVETNTDGSWEAGVPLDREDPGGAASPGYIMPNMDGLQDFIDSADSVEDRTGYFQEFAPEVAVDESKVDSLDLEIETDLGQFHNVLRTFETTALEPEVADYKYYAPGLGQIRVEELDAESDLAVDLTVDLTGVRSLIQDLASPLEELGAETFANGAQQKFVTFIGAEGDHAVGVYEVGGEELEIGGGSILFSSTAELPGPHTETVSLAADAGLGVFIIPAGGTLDQQGIDLGQFEDGGLTFTSPFDFTPASLYDGTAPLVSHGPLNFESPVNLPDFCGEEEVLPLPLQVFHGYDASQNGINLLNPAGGVQAQEIEWASQNEDLDLLLLGFEDTRVTDPEHDGDYNDVILAVSDSPLDADLIDQLAAQFGYDTDPLAA